jgi:transposase
MPKLKNPEQDRRKEIKGQFKHNMERCGYKNVTAVAARMGVSVPTVYSWLENPDKIRLEQLRMLWRVLRYTDEEKLPFIS